MADRGAITDLEKRKHDAQDERRRLEQARQDLIDRHGAWAQKRRHHLHALIADLNDKIRRLTRRIKRRRAGGPTVMYDSVTVSRIPSDAPAVAGYVNGIFTTWPAILQRFPRARKLSIAVTSSANADTLDIEPGNATPSSAVAWIRRQKDRGVKRPVVYANVSTMPLVLNVLRNAGIGRESVRVWTAHYGRGEHICGPQCGFGFSTEADGTQWIERHDLNLDINKLTPDFFGGG